MKYPQDIRHKKRQRLLEEIFKMDFLKQKSSPRAKQIFTKKEELDENILKSLVPLDMVFINADGTIRSIAENTTPRSLAVIDSGGLVRATLELAGGMTAKLDIRVGDTVKQRIFGNAP